MQLGSRAELRQIVGDLQDQQPTIRKLARSQLNALAGARVRLLAIVFLAGAVVGCVGRVL